LKKPWLYGEKFKPGTLCTYDEYAGTIIERIFVNRKTFLDYFCLWVWGCFGAGYCDP